MPDPQDAQPLAMLHRRLALATAALLLPFLVLFLTWIGDGFRALYSPKTRMGYEIFLPWFLGGTLAFAVLASEILLIQCARAPREGEPASSPLRPFGLLVSGAGLCAVAVADAGLITELVYPRLGLKAIQLFPEFGWPGFAIGLGLALVGAFTIPRGKLRDDGSVPG